jgi:hypothetical protein
MNNRIAAALVLVAGTSLPALAQTPSVSYDIHWVALPSNQSFAVMLGDYVQVVVGVGFSPPVGTQIVYSTPTASGVGTVAGLGSISFDLRACHMTTSATQWTLSGTGFQGTTGNTWGLRNGWQTGTAGTPQNDSSIIGISSQQFLITGLPVIQTNPVPEIWRGKLSSNQPLCCLQVMYTCYPNQQTVLVMTGVDVNGLPVYVPVPATANMATTQVLWDTGGTWPCWVNIDQHPQDAAVPDGTSAMFSAHGTSTCAITYQWTRGCTVLSDGGRISGATTANLRIDGVTAADEDVYEVTMNQNRTGGALLRVTCYANCDQSTGAPVLNANDFQCFLNRFAAGDSYANCDGSTSPPVLNANDFQCFMNKFAAGCP